MINRLIFICLLLPLATIAQKREPKVMLPVIQGKIVYDSTYTSTGKTTEAEVLAKATKWFKTEFTFPGSGLTAIDKPNRRVSGTGIFKIPVSDDGHYYWMRADISVQHTDIGYRIVLTNVYEKPVEPGISNEYSKLEYRWRDYKDGKPWSAEDDNLFTGFVAALGKMQKSLQTNLGLNTAVIQPKFRVLAFYSTVVESDHVDFARDCISFYTQLAAEQNFMFEVTTDWKKLNPGNLRNYQVVMWINDFPQDEAQRKTFEDFMENGGAWMGYHVSGYNDGTTKWPWIVNFLGATFYNNNWPPLPAKLIVDDNTHPATRSLPKSYVAPITEWYGWKPNPRDNKNIKVLLTMDPSNYPFGKKDVIRGGDIPVVWTNTRYRMIYLNMGHGDMVFKSPLQNKMFSDALFWLGTVPK